MHRCYLIVHRSRGGGKRWAVHAMAFRSQEEVEVLKLNRLCAQDGTSRARPCMKISDSDFASKSVFTPEADYKYERRNVKVKHETWTGTSTQRILASGWRNLDTQFNRYFGVKSFAVKQFSFEVWLF